MWKILWKIVLHIRIHFWGLQSHFMWEVTINTPDPWSASFSWLQEEEFHRSGKWPRMNMDWDPWRILIKWIWECHLRCERKKDYCHQIKIWTLFNVWNWSFRCEECRVHDEDVRGPAGGRHHWRCIKDTWIILQMLSRWVLRGRPRREK